MNDTHIFLLELLHDSWVLLVTTHHIVQDINGVDRFSKESQVVASRFKPTKYLLRNLNTTSTSLRSMAME